MLIWDENKRRENLRKHGIDFAELDAVFDSDMLTSPDFTPHEQRLRSMGLFKGKVVVLVWQQIGDSTRVISCRYGERYESRKYFRSTQLDR
ncbi:BrnT family toxin [Oxalobacteraceae bacterium A2-2]